MYTQYDESVSISCGIYCTFSLACISLLTIDILHFYPYYIKVTWRERHGPKSNPTSALKAFSGWQESNIKAMQLWPFAGESMGQHGNGEGPPTEAAWYLKVIAASTRMILAGRQFHSVIAVGKDEYRKGLFWDRGCLILCPCRLDSLGLRVMVTWQ